MATVREVLDRYDAKVPFPITPEKIEAAGYDVQLYLDSMIDELRAAEDSHEPRVKAFLSVLEGLKAKRLS